MFDGGGTGGVFGSAGGLGDVLPEHVPTEGFEDLMEQAPAVAPGMQQAAAGMGQVPAYRPPREVPRRQPAPQMPMMPPGAPQQAAAGMGAFQVPVGATGGGTSGGALTAAFLGGVLVAGVGYGAYRIWQNRNGE